MPFNRKKIFFALPFIILPVILLAGLVVMFLWNAILPAAVHASSISYWQATGLLILCRILFGSFRGRPGMGGPGGRRPDMFRRGPEWREKWKNMSDEDRMRFREEWRRRCRRPGEEQENS